MSEKKVLLYIEDEPHKLLSELLKDEGFEIIEALNGDDAIDKLHSIQDTKNSIDVILLDVRMIPGSKFQSEEYEGGQLTGLGIMDKISESKIKAPVIVLTGNPNPNLREEFSKYGIYQFIHKSSSLSLEYLISLIKEAAYENE